MSGAAIYDALQSSPELISLNMTGVLIVYSSMFARWAFVVKPQNLLLAGCHVANVCAQGNQLRRAVEYKRERGMDGEVRDILAKAAMTVIAGAACVIVGPTLQGAIVNANLGPISTVAAADAGPLYVFLRLAHTHTHTHTLAHRHFPCRECVKITNFVPSHSRRSPPPPPPPARPPEIIHR